MSYHKRGSSIKLSLSLEEKAIALSVLLGENVTGQRKKAERKTRDWNKAYKGSDLKFMVREEGLEKKTPGIPKD